MSPLQAPAPLPSSPTEAEAERWLLGRELFGMSFGLDRMHRLMTALGLPQRRFASVHVVGSNGKSSTARLTAGVLERHGVRTGTYTSPHLRRFAERIEIGGRALDGDAFANAIARVARAAELVERGLPVGEHVTQFEALTAAAFHELARRGVEVAVIEAGLGGRLDATNVIPSRVQVLTGVGLEHTRWLGPTLADVAGEKLAVVGDHGVLVTGPLAPEAEAVAERVTAERRARRVRVEAADPFASGGFPRANLCLAAAAAEAVLGRLDPAAVVRAGAEVRVPGRLEVVSERPRVLFDGAHNAPGAAALAAALPAVLEGRELVLVLSLLDDKDASGVLGALAPLAGHAVVTRAGHPRALDPTVLARLVGEAAPDLTVVREPDPTRALLRARDAAGAGGAVLVTGSLYLLADLLRDPEAPGASTL